MSAALRDARRDRGLTLEALGREVGLTATALSYYENDRATPGPAAAKRIADFFGVRQSEFWPSQPPEREAA